MSVCVCVCECVCVYGCVLMSMKATGQGFVSSFLNHCLLLEIMNQLLTEVGCWLAAEPGVPPVSVPSVLRLQTGTPKSAFYMGPGDQTYILKTHFYEPSHFFYSFLAS